MISGLWDIAYDAGWDETYETCKPAHDGPAAFAWHFANGAEWGAGWMAAIMGMAQSIRDKHREACHWAGHPWEDAAANPRRCVCGHICEARFRL